MYAWKKNKEEKYNNKEHPYKSSSAASSDVFILSLYVYSDEE